MKRFLSFVIGIFTVSISAFAADSTTFYVGETGISVSLPASNYVITPDTPLSDPVFSVMGFDDPQAVLDQNIANGILIDSIDPNYSYEIVIGSPDIGDVSGLSLSDLDDATINQTAEAMKPQFEDMGINVMQYSILKDYSEPYLVFDISQRSQDQTLYSRECYTVVNGTALYITLHDLSGSQLSDINSQVLDTVVRSTSFPEPDVSAISEDEAYQSIDPDNQSSIPFHETQLYNTLVDAAAGVVSTGIIIGIVFLVRKIKNKS